MSELLRGIIVSHAAVAEALVTAVRAITGIDGALLPVSNEGCDQNALKERLLTAAAGQPAVLFVDLPGGSCLTSSIRFARGRADLAVVTGVNLAMLLDFVFHRDVLPAEAARRAVESGAKAIKVGAA
jgi:mannose/fructose-specific phosphotransferase system component IIA